MELSIITINNLIGPDWLLFSDQMCDSTTMATLGILTPIHPQPFTFHISGLKAPAFVPLSVHRRHIHLHQLLGFLFTQSPFTALGRNMCMSVDEWGTIISRATNIPRPIHKSITGLAGVIQFPLPFPCWLAGFKSSFLCLRWLLCCTTWSRRCVRDCRYTNMWTRNNGGWLISKFKSLIRPANICEYSREKCSRGRLRFVDSIVPKLLFAVQWMRLTGKQNPSHPPQPLA